MTWVEIRNYRVVQHRMIWIVIEKMFTNQSFTEDKAVINGKMVPIYFSVSQLRFKIS